MSTTELKLSQKPQVALVEEADLQAVVRVVPKAVAQGFGGSAHFGARLRFNGFMAIEIPKNRLNPANHAEFTVANNFFRVFGAFRG
jgi:hypothetical protein